MNYKLDIFILIGIIVAGIFVRGKKQQGGSSLDSKTGNQWLTFGGGQKIATAGVVDAFTGRH